uniref:JmjC domain-containing protein n=1 Tax=Caenorhabditis tropicalis TaxID=1561998 RepID=A0A1I7V009_9PELO
METDVLPICSDDEGQRLEGQRPGPPGPDHRHCLPRREKPHKIFHAFCVTNVVDAKVVPSASVQKSSGKVLLCFGKEAEEEKQEESSRKRNRIRKCNFR